MRWVELAGLILGVGLIVVATGAVDWRAGVFTAGLFLILASLDIRSQP